MKRPGAPALLSCVLALSVVALASPLGAAQGRAPADAAAVAVPQPAAPLAPVPGLSYRFERVADGVFCAIASGVPYYVANAVVIVGDDGLLLVDPGPGPNEARVLRDAIRTVSDLPVRYLVDTHGHFDHAFGNEAFPDAQTIGHEATRSMLGPGAMALPTVAGNVQSMPERIAGMREQGARELDGGKRAEGLRQADALEAYHRELVALVPRPPSVSFDGRLTVWLGRREVRLLHLGRGHTGGDVVVFLPQQRVACTGDLFNGGIGYMGDAYVDEWANTLDRLAGLEFETVIPGHGTPFRGKDRIAPVQAVLRDVWRQAEALARAGVAVDDAASRIDLRSHAASFPRFAKAGFEPTAVRRIYEVIAERAAAAAPSARAVQ